MLDERRRNPQHLAVYWQQTRGDDENLYCSNGIVSSYQTTIKRVNYDYSDANRMYPRSNDRQIIYLKNAITKDNIRVGDFTVYKTFTMIPVILKTGTSFITIPSTMTG
jgi:hypothetical protein